MNIFKKKHLMTIEYFIGCLNCNAKFLYSVDDEIGAAAMDRLIKKIKSDKDFSDKILKVINGEER